MKVISKKIVGKRIVYDLSVKDNHNYYVSDSEILVHNSGKGFIIQNLLGMEGKVFDVDELKRMVFKLADFPAIVKATSEDLFASGEIKKRYKPSDIIRNPKALRNSEIVRIVHEATRRMGIKDKKESAFFQSVEFMPPEKKPNIIFDVTLASYTKLINITNDISRLGYDKKNIHIVWVVNDVKVAMKQNQERDRVVPEDILFDTHKGAATTMADIISNSKKTRKYMDGSIFLAFNKRGVDAEVVVTDKGSFSGKKTGEKTITITKANYIKVKEPGKDVNLSSITSEVQDKIIKYVPKNTFMMD